MQFAFFFFLCCLKLKKFVFINYVYDFEDWFCADLILLSLMVAVVAVRVCQIIAVCFCAVDGDRNWSGVDGSGNLNLMLRTLFEDIWRPLNTFWRPPKTSLKTFEHLRCNVLLVLTRFSVAFCSILIWFVQFRSNPLVFEVLIKYLKVFNDDRFVSIDVIERIMSYSN